MDLALIREKHTEGYYKFAMELWAAVCLQCFFLFCFKSKYLKLINQRKINKSHSVSMFLSLRLPSEVNAASLVLLLKGRSKVLGSSWNFGPLWIYAQSSVVPICQNNDSPHLRCTALLLSHSNCFLESREVGEWPTGKRLARTETLGRAVIGSARMPHSFTVKTGHVTSSLFVTGQCFQNLCGLWKPKGSFPRVRMSWRGLTL